MEHEWAEILGKEAWTTPVDGFGSSDCHCASHFFYCEVPPDQVALASNLGGTIEVITLR